MAPVSTDMRKCPYKEGVRTAQNQMPLHIVGRSLPPFRRLMAPVSTDIIRGGFRGALGAEAPPSPRLPPFAEKFICLHYHQRLSSLYMIMLALSCTLPLLLGTIH